MIRMMLRSYSWLACLAITTLILGAPFASAQSITHAGTTLDQTDYSPTGLNLGTAGFWFAQFNQTAGPVTNAPVDDNDVNMFPSWVLPDFNKANTGTPGYTFCLSQDCFSKGGDTSWDTLKLPDGTTGLSGAVVDPNTAGNSNNTIRSLLLGPGTPPAFLMHIVVDNTDGDHNPDGRLRARGERQGVGGFDISGPNDPPPSTYNGTADVYTFKYLGFQAGDFIKLQLNSGGSALGPPASISGLMFDVIPEPSSLVLLVLSAVGFVVPGRRR